MLPVAGLLAAGLAAGPAAPAAAQPSGTWTRTGSMTTPDASQTATVLHNGQVLVIHGASSAELYDPATGKWAATGSMPAGRSGFTATVLQNGQVLVAGGADLGNQAVVTNSAELYNRATGTWAPTGSITAARQGHTATLLPNGQVLVAGGDTCLYGGCPALASAELYNPATGTWAPTGSMNVARSHHTATLLPNGQVLAAGGDAGSAELYNPATGGGH